MRKIYDSLYNTKKINKTVQIGTPTPKTVNK